MTMMTVLASKMARRQSFYFPIDGWTKGRVGAFRWMDGWWRGGEEQQGQRATTTSAPGVMLCDAWLV